MSNKKPKRHVELLEQERQRRESDRLWLELKKALLDMQFQNIMRKVRERSN